MKVKILFPLAVFFLVLFTSCSKGDDGLGGGPGPTPPVAASTTLNVAYGTDPLQKMDIYLPANRTVTTTKVLIMIHGGAWIGGDKNDFNVIIDSLKKRLPDYAIFNINYRLAALPSTNPFPTQENDVKTAVEFIYSNRTANLVSDKFVLMGGSAGGHLALLQAYKYQTPVKIKAVIDFFGPTNMATMYSDYASNPLGQLGIFSLMGNTTPTANPTFYAQSSPITYATTAAACPTIILQGGADVTVYPTQSSTLRDKLTMATVVNQYVLYPLLGHGPWDAATNTDAMNKIQPFLAANVQ